MGAPLTSSEQATRERIRSSLPLEALLFDVDGTLVDTASLLIRSLRFSLQTHLGGEYPDEQLRDLLGIPLRRQMALFSTDRTPELIETFMRFYEDHQDEEKPFTDALALLPWARSRGYRTCLVTSKSAPEMVITIGRFPGLADVDDMVTSDLTKNVKPHPEPALLALDRLRTTRAIMVGDSPYDIQCARSAGILAGAALWGPFTRTKLQSFEPDHWFETPAHLKEFLDAAGPDRGP